MFTNGLRRFAMATSARRVFMIALAMLAFSACDDTAGGIADDETLTVVPPGKMDDFYSSSAQEYYIEGIVPITLDATGRTPATRTRSLRRRAWRP